MTREQKLREWLKSNNREKIASELGLTNKECEELCWELNLTKMPYRPCGMQKENYIVWLTKAQCEAAHRGRK